VQPQYLIVDGHSVIFAWPELRTMHERRTALARDELIKQLRDYQDWTGVARWSCSTGRGAPSGSARILARSRFFTREPGRPRMPSVERLASKYAPHYRLLVATSDYLEQETVSACGAEYISAKGLRGLLESARTS
jgi:predicted RNA-binding protein with PIN domain